MQDEAPDGQPQDVGEVPDGPPEPGWWPWPETQVEQPTGPRDGAPGDETLGFPLVAEPGSMAQDPAPDAPRSAAIGPEPGSAPEAGSGPQPEPDPEPGPDPDLDPEPGAERDPEPDAERDPEADPGTPAERGTTAEPGTPTEPGSPAAPPAADRPEDASSGAGVSPAGGVALPVAAVQVATAVSATEVRNEAIPSVPPAAGTGPVGSIPAAHARAAWSRLQASNWRLFLIRFLSAGLAVVVTVVIVPGLGFVGWSPGQFVRIAIVFGLLNALVKPLLQFLVLRFIFSTYGIVVVVINVLLLLLLGKILDDTFEVYRPLALVVGGLVVGILGLIFETLLGATPPVLDRDYKERNGLR